MTITGSIAQALVLRMHAAGHSYSAIGRALGRDSSAISQIASGKRGANYGKSYTKALVDVEHELKNRAAGAPAHPIVQPARRTIRGRPAAVRQPARGKNKWGVASTKQQATRTGARSLGGRLEEAKALGRNHAAVSVAVSKSVNVKRSGGRPTRKGAKGDQEIRCELDAAFDTKLKASGGDFTAALASWLKQSGHVEAIRTSQIHAIELSTWTG
jgi:hypothetical protein